MVGNLGFKGTKYCVCGGLLIVYIVIVYVLVTCNILILVCTIIIIYTLHMLT
jgi:hypothetical protein